MAKKLHLTKEEKTFFINAISGHSNTVDDFRKIKKLKAIVEKDGVAFTFDDDDFNYACSRFKTCLFNGYSDKSVTTALDIEDKLDNAKKEG